MEPTHSLTLDPAGAGVGRRIYFRADRVDRYDQGERWTDYKTGWPPQLLTPGTLQEKVRTGEWLQLAAYVAAAGPSDDAAVRGRYLFLAPGATRERSLSADNHDRELRARFTATATALLQLWEDGNFFPRLVLPQDDVEPERCADCAVAAACLRRDSGSRVRLRHLMEPPAPATNSALAVWNLRRQR